MLSQAMSEKYLCVPRPAASRRTHQLLLARLQWDGECRWSQMTASGQKQERRSLMPDPRFNGHLRAPARRSIAASVACSENAAKPSNSVARGPRVVDRRCDDPTDRDRQRFLRLLLLARSFTHQPTRNPMGRRYWPWWAARVHRAGTRPRRGDERGPVPEPGARPGNNQGPRTVCAEGHAPAVIRGALTALPAEPAVVSRRRRFSPRHCSATRIETLTPQRSRG
jgi:hypothetical protein